MPHFLSISPGGRLFVVLVTSPDEAAAETPARAIKAFEQGEPAGLVHLATVELRTHLPPDWAFAREFAMKYLTALCHVPLVERGAAQPLPPPGEEELAEMIQSAPPMRGLEYLNASVLRSWWEQLDQWIRGRIETCPGGASAYLKELNPQWRLVGRVTFHLAENKRDETHPFAFMATYTARLSKDGEPRHQPLSRALQEYAGAENREGLLKLLTPIHEAAGRLEWVKQLVETGALYEPLAWTAPQAYAMLCDVEALEQCGLVVRIPNWWKRQSLPRPRVDVRIGQGRRPFLGAQAMVDFRISVAMGDEDVSEAELRELLAGTSGLVRFRGQWVEVDNQKLKAALEHWKRVEQSAGSGEISFYEGMRLLAGTQMTGQGIDSIPSGVREWTGITAGEALERILSESRDAQGHAAAPAGLKATLRPYQLTGAHWLRFMTRLGLGACLADDMGLGKTIQVLSLLLWDSQERDNTGESEGMQGRQTLIVMPASLVANWQKEIQKFAPSLKTLVAYPSDRDFDPQDRQVLAERMNSADLVLTTYGMLGRIELMREWKWGRVILDEAQAIKNSGARQARTVKELKAPARIALTGTPIENRLSDLWSLFDFLNPGLLGSAKTFGQYVKTIEKGEHRDYAPLRKLTSPYILRRLKTDRQVIADLPEKTEVKAYCQLKPLQAVEYERAVQELVDQISGAEGIGRRGIILSFLMRLKQICNHPSQSSGDNDYKPENSGKFHRLGELCEQLASRQEKALIFTQFKEITQPLADFLSGIFKRPGLILHGGTPVARRRELVEMFQKEEGPPFFVLSLKAGGTGLNLTAASHVIHFDRWWNPAVENQATDRAFRIGQKRNVLVHKFVCQGTVEEKIDALIGDKIELANTLLEGTGVEKMLTEMNDRELLKFVALDINGAQEA